MASQITLENYCIKWVKNQTLYPNDDPEQAKCHLNVGLFYSEVYENPRTKQTMVCSSNNQLFYMLLHYLQCSVTFIRSTEDYGGRIVDGHWTGILSLFERKEADLVGHVFPIVNRREEIVDQFYLMPKQELLSIFSFTKLPPNHGNPFRMFECFDVFLWILIAISLILCATIHYLDVSLNYCNHFDQPKSKWLRLIYHYLDTFSILIGQGDHHSSSMILRDPFIFWMIGSFILRQLFSNDFTAFLLSQRNVKIDYFDQLYQLPSSYRIMLEPNSSTAFFFEKNYPELMKRVEWYSHVDIISVEMLDNLIEENYVLIINAQRSATLKEYYPGTNFHISAELLMPTLGTYAVRPTLDKESRLRLSRLFKALHHFGLMLHVDRRLLLNHLRAQSDDVLVRKHKPQVLQNKTKNQDVQALSGLTILSFMYLYLIGIFCSFMCFILELLYHEFLFKSQTNS